MCFQYVLIQFTCAVYVVTYGLVVVDDVFADDFLVVTLICLVDVALTAVSIIRTWKGERRSSRT